MCEPPAKSSVCVCVRRDGAYCRARDSSPCRAQKQASAGVCCRWFDIFKPTCLSCCKTHSNTTDDKQSSAVRSPPLPSFFSFFCCCVLVLCSFFNRFFCCSRRSFHAQTSRDYLSPTPPTHWGVLSLEEVCVLF